LRSWPEKGRPKDPAAWLIFVGRNAALDEKRRRRRLEALPEEGLDVPLAEVEKALVEGLDHRAYRDDVLRLLFVCCHPELPPAQQIALALRVVAGLSVAEIARAFLVKTRTMEQRITRAKRKVASAGIPFAVPNATERAERLRGVSAMIYLVFNEGYAASGGELHIRTPLCREAIRLARLLLRLFPAEVEIMGLLALCLVQHARRDARLDAYGQLVLLEDQDRTLWDHELIAEGHALLEKALRHGRPGPFQLQAAIAAMHARAQRAEDTNWQEIDRLYVLLERVQPSPVVTLNRAVAVAKAKGPREALDLIAPLGDSLVDYFHFHGVRGGLLAEVGDPEGATRAWARALELARTPAESAHVQMLIDRLEKKSPGPMSDA
jgi:RNA polymerase sigma-70 factor (ECF subfamily)